MLALLAGLPGGLKVRAQSVVTEPQPRFIPAGQGRTKPFDVTRHTIPLSEIRESVPRDVIPALSNPSFLAADQVHGGLKDSDRVLGVSMSGASKAYPIRILNWHELVNDSVGGRPILVSW